MNQEIEKKYSIVDIPKLDKTMCIRKIIQEYVYQDTFSAIRKRKIYALHDENDCKYMYTVKTKGNTQSQNVVYEIENEITKETYDSILGNVYHVIEKWRIEIPIGNKKIAELDIYDGELEGLITVEVEFEQESEIKDFSKPIWFGKELDKKRFSNANLSKMDKTTFRALLPEQEYEQNIIIKEKIEAFWNTKRK